MEKSVAHYMLYSEHKKGKVASVGVDDHHANEVEWSSHRIAEKIVQSGPKVFCDPNVRTDIASPVVFSEPLP